MVGFRFITIEARSCARERTLSDSLVHSGAWALGHFLVMSLCFAGWLPIDSITTRAGKWDLTCENNARSVVEDSGGNIHIVWCGDTLGVYQVWYSCWSRATRSWSVDTILTGGLGSVTEPAVAVDSSGNVYVAWTSSGVLKLRRRDAATRQWLPADTLIGQHSDTLVTLAIDRSGVQHLVWLRNPSGQTSVCYVQHSSTGWDTVRTVAGPAIATSQPSVATAPDGRLMVVWRNGLQSVAIWLAFGRMGFGSIRKRSSLRVTATGRASLGQLTLPFMLSGLWMVPVPRSTSYTAHASILDGVIPSE